MSQDTSHLMINCQLSSPIEDPRDCVTSVVRSRALDTNVHRLSHSKSWKKFGSTSMMIILKIMLLIVMNMTRNIYSSTMGY